MRRLIVSTIVVLALAACGSSGGSGSFTFSPATINCSNPAAETETAQLPSSVKATDTFTDTVNGTTIATGAVSTGFQQQPDGTWRSITQETVAALQGACAAVTSNGLITGTNTAQILDSSGKVLAQGSFTVVR